MWVRGEGVGEAGAGGAGAAQATRSRSSANSPTRLAGSRPQGYLAAPGRFRSTCHRAGNGDRVKQQGL